MFHEKIIGLGSGFFQDISKFHSLFYEIFSENPKFPKTCITVEKRGSVISGVISGTQYLIPGTWYRLLLF
jgi:hypothetical protein